MPKGWTLENDVPTGWSVETPEESGLLDNLTALVKGTINPALLSMREGTTNILQNILTSPPAVQEGLGPLGNRLVRGTAGMLNPLPGNVGDVARDAALLALPGGTAIKSAIRAAAGTGAAAGGAYLGGESPTAAAMATLPSLALGEGMGLAARRSGLAGRQQEEDVGNVTAALNRTLKGQTVPEDVAGMFKSVAGQEIRNQARARYRDQLEQIAQSGGLEGNRPFAIIPEIEPNRPVTFDEATNFLARMSERGPYQGKETISARQASRQASELRQQIVSELEKGNTHPLVNRAANPQAAAAFQEASADYFRNRTVERLLKAPGVLDDTGKLNMQALQDAFKTQMLKNQIPESVSADLQAAIFRGAKPPGTDQFTAGPLQAIIPAAGLAGGSLIGHPYAGLHLAHRIAPKGSWSYVGETAQPSFLRKLIGPTLGSQLAQELAGE